MKIVINVMVAEGAVLKRGVAPPSGNDHEIQNLLDGLVEDAELGPFCFSRSSGSVADAVCL